MSKEQKKIIKEEIFKWLTIIQKGILNYPLLYKSLRNRHGNRMLYRNKIKFQGPCNLILIEVSNSDNKGGNEVFGRIQRKVIPYIWDLEKCCMKVIPELWLIHQQVKMVQESGIPGQGTHINQWYPKRDPQTSSISIMWETIRHANSLA